MNLVLIPARGGSRGIPGKNINKLAGKPLICYSLDVARELEIEKIICVSTDSANIAEMVKDYGFEVPFIRPDYLATDEAGTRGVILHALEFYAQSGIEFDSVVLLQPTSPLRNVTQVSEAYSLFKPDIDMVVSVNKSHANPYYNIFEESETGFLFPSKRGNFTRRQDCPDVYLINGAIYVINPESIKKDEMAGFRKIVKYEIDRESAVDIDDMTDWRLAEILIKSRNV